MATERALSHLDPLRGLVYAGAALGKVAQRIRKIAAGDSTVLIHGETGTGKEVCAQAIHYLSARAGKPCVAINCGAIPTELVESELFGHVKGAFTAAGHPRTGLIRDAEGGTLFLDDVDCLPLAAQAKLLRFLQEREYRCLGANAVHHADVRVVAASNRQLSDLVPAGQFRADLFYRLNVLTLALPPLRERREDIEPLALHYLRQCALDQGRPDLRLTCAALLRLLAHAWPGNVRELRHVIERAVLLSESAEIEAEDIELDAAPDAGRQALDSFQTMKARMIDSFERQYLETVLASSHGNVAAAARTAGKHRRAFFELMRKHSITAEAFRSTSR
jgi:two-component system, NtrC family, response regulator GlrR